MQHRALDWIGGTTSAKKALVDRGTGRPYAASRDFISPSLQGRPRVYKAAVPVAGYQDPHYQISGCNINESDSCGLPVNARTCSSSPSNSLSHTSLHGVSSWDPSQLLAFPPNDSIDFSLDPISLPSSSSSSSLSTLTNDFPVTSGAPFCDITDWSALSSCSNLIPFSGDGLTYPLVTSDALGTTLAPVTDLQYDSTLTHAMAPGPSTSGSSSTSSRKSQSPKMSSTKSSNANSPLVETARIEKRKANTMAARRYRQKRVDQMSGLEAQLKETQSERDDLKVRCARLEGEVETLRALLKAQTQK
ncbi:unnamed protein product [Periconia digitata]|uniref:BZIP domain-containing protein n=1 Tax=Periconia digitata TaxID=1303443 RepID=A0A9W4UKB8_9PLEO|nr:unnamed protein product [Periconia digitata]